MSCFIGNQHVETFCGQAHRMAWQFLLPEVKQFQFFICSTNKLYSFRFYILCNLVSYILFFVKNPRHTLPETSDSSLTRT